MGGVDRRGATVARIALEHARRNDWSGTMTLPVQVRRGVTAERRRWFANATLPAPAAMAMVPALSGVGSAAPVAPAVMPIK